MPAKKQCSDRDVDWDSIKIIVIPEGEPNSHNPYSSFTPEQRREQLRALYQRIIERKIEHLQKIDVLIDKTISYADFSLDFSI